MSLIKRLLWSRYGWFLKGLPNVPRATALMKIRHHTMTSHARSAVLWDRANAVCESNVPGDFVECGVWKGGSSGLMGLVLEGKSEFKNRRLHLFDSFEGLPEPGEHDGQHAADYSGGANSGSLTSIHQCEAGIDEVKNFLFGELHLPSDGLVFHQGWFQDTLPALGTEPSAIALLRLDGDWYESTKVCLDHLYPRLSKGGVVLLDDYNCWEGCRKATDEYRAEHGINDEIIVIDSEAAYWIKS